MGFADALVNEPQSMAQAAELLRGFLMGVLHEKPILFSGQSTLGGRPGRASTSSFTKSAIPTRPTIRSINPFGMWRLTKIR